MLWLRQGDMASAARWAARQERAASGTRPRFTAYDYDRFALTHIDLAQGHLDAAYAAATELLHDAEATDHGRSVIWALVLQALILQAQGDPARALDALARALALAEPRAMCGSSLMKVLPMAALLTQFAGHQCAGERAYTAGSWLPFPDELKN